MEKISFLGLRTSKYSSFLFNTSYFLVKVLNPISNAGSFLLVSTVESWFISPEFSESPTLLSPPTFSLVLDDVLAFKLSLSSA